MKRIFLIALCMGFFAWSASACAVEMDGGAGSEASGNSEQTWSDENVDDNGWI